jgi:hypothetical protein
VYGPLELYVSVVAGPPVKSLGKNGQSSSLTTNVYVELIAPSPGKP